MGVCASRSRAPIQQPAEAPPSPFANVCLQYAHTGSCSKTAEGKECRLIHIDPETMLKLTEALANSRADNRQDNESHSIARGASTGLPEATAPPEPLWDSSAASPGEAAAYAAGMAAANSSSDTSAAADIDGPRDRPSFVTSSGALGQAAVVVTTDELRTLMNDTLATARSSAGDTHHAFFKFVPGKTWLVTETGQCYHAWTMCRGLCGARTMRFSLDPVGYRPCALCVMTPAQLQKHNKGDR